MQLRFSLHGALIAIAERICHSDAIRVQAHIIDGPTIDRNGPNAFCRDGRGMAQALLHASFHRCQVPLQAFGGSAGRIGKAVDKPYHRPFVNPTQQ
jgi:hypothetical protein